MIFFLSNLENPLWPISWLLSTEASPDRLLYPIPSLAWKFFLSLLTARCYHPQSFGDQGSLGHDVTSLKQSKFCPRKMEAKFVPSSLNGVLKHESTYQFQKVPGRDRAVCLLISCDRRRSGKPATDSLKSQDSLARLLVEWPCCHSLLTVVILRSELS